MKKRLRVVGSALWRFLGWASPKNLLLVTWRFAGWLSLRRLLFIGLVAVVVGGIWLSPLRPIVRDFVVAAYAHVRAGPPVPVEVAYEPTPGQIDYALSLLVGCVTGYEGTCQNYTWDIASNSRYLIEQALLIVPYFAYEQVTVHPVYPQMTFFSPLPGESSFHVLGQAAVASVRYNERLLTGDVTRWDERLLLAIMVHEMTHLQGGNFRQSEDTPLPEMYEANTQSATLEVLAGMCQHGRDLACGAFWMEVEDWARQSLQARMSDLRLDWAYQIVADVLWRTAEQERASEKAQRYWARNPDELEYIIEAYGRRPWEQIVIPGVVSNARLVTGKTVTVDVILDGRPSLGQMRLLMPFDDARATMPLLLRWWIWVLR